MSLDKCPKCNYRRAKTASGTPSDSCPACGIIFEKWLARQRGQVDIRNQFDTRESSDSVVSALKTQIFQVPDNIDPVVFWGRIATLAGLTLWTVYFVVGGVNWERIGGSFLHNINLPFHEFGHVLFSPFGHFLMILGGSLFQVAMPLGLMIAFSLFRADNFGAAVMLWWSGQNFVDVSPYIADDQLRVLPLIGGAGEDSHDWGNLLTMTNSLANTQQIAHTSFSIGCFFMLLALTWAAYIGYLQKQQLGDSYP